MFLNNNKKNNNRGKKKYGNNKFALYSFFFFFKESVRCKLRLKIYILDQDILWLNVPVYHLVTVDILNCLNDLPDELLGLMFFEPFVRLQLQQRI